MANETMRIFFSLKIVTYPQGEYGVEDNPTEITPAEAVTYEDAILAAIAKENRFFENATVALPSTYTVKISIKRCIACTRQLKSSTVSCGES